MIQRRTLLVAAASASILPLAGAAARHAPQVQTGSPRSYRAFLGGVEAQAIQLGISRSILEVALALDQPNQRVLELDRHQPEFTLTWSQYRQRVLTGRKVQAAQAAYQARLDMLTRIWQRYRVDPRIAVGIWGLESNYGARIGSFGVIDSLATLAFDGRRAAFFHAELMNGLRILQQRDIEPGRMLGSYAGAMGQPQFMPSSYLRYAVDYDGDGRRDIWSSEADVLASISNYLARNGWVAGAPWGQPVSIPPGFNIPGSGSSKGGRQASRSLDAWMQVGVRRHDGAPFSRGNVPGALLLPDGADGEAFMVYSNFDVIRRYNPSDFYSLAVGLLGNAAA